MIKAIFFLAGAGSVVLVTGLVLWLMCKYEPYDASDVYLDEEDNYDSTHYEPDSDANTNDH